MARKKKTSDDIAIEERDAERKERGIIGDNTALTDDERRALLFSHRRLWEAEEANVVAAQAAVTAAKAARKKVEKLAQAEYGEGAVQDIKDLILLEQPKGGEAAKADMERLARLARWLNLAVGTQVSFLDEDRRPSEDIAFENGKVAGLKGDICQPPHDPSVPQHQRWMQGWHAGQEILLSDWRDKLKLPVTDDEDTGGEQTDLADRNDLPDTSDAPFHAPEAPAQPQ